MTSPRSLENFDGIITSLEKDGYCHIPGVYSSDQVTRALKLVRYWYDRTVNLQSHRMPYLNANQPMVYNLQNKDKFFLEILFAKQELHEILMHFLNDSWFRSVPESNPNYILRSFLARSSNHRMPLHIDAFVPYLGSYVFIMQCAIILENQNEENGCTMIVPGTHISGKYTKQEDFHSAIPIESKAGDLVIWDSRVWHGASENNQKQTRWAIIATFQRWWLKQAFNIPGSLPQEIYDSLTMPQKGILGFCSIPYDNEEFGIDMKRSYDLLPNKVGDYKR